MFDELDVRLEALPCVQAGKGVFQNKFHQFDVYGHTLEAVHNVYNLNRRNREAKAAAWLHDIGKPIVATPLYEDGQFQYGPNGEVYYSFKGHEYASAFAVRAMESGFFARFSLDQEKIACLVESHELIPRGIKKLKKTDSFEEFFKLFSELHASARKVDRWDMRQVTMFALADRTAQKEQGLHDFTPKHPGGINIFRRLFCCVHC